MSKKPTTPTDAELSQAANQLATIHNDMNDKARDVAIQVGYEGSLTVGSLEDEIRFYQRRTVEACLELGKRLLVLKELTPHGDFMHRAMQLGFTDRTANRFMQAAAKTSKSANLANLSGQVKSMSAFLELVTHDEDTLDDISKLDDIDRMSASQLRSLARNLKAENQAKDQVLDDTQKKLTKVQLENKKKIVADTNWPDALAPITEQVAAAGRKLVTGLCELERCRVTLLETLHGLPTEEQERYATALVHVTEVYEEALAKAERYIGIERTAFDNSLGNYGANA